MHRVKDQGEGLGPGAWIQGMKQVPMLRSMPVHARTVALDCSGICREPIAVTCQVKRGRARSAVPSQLAGSTCAKNLCSCVFLAYPHAILLVEFIGSHRSSDSRLRARKVAPSKHAAELKCAQHFYAVRLAV